MSDYISQVNSTQVYLVVGAVLLFITVMCAVHLVKAWKTGVAAGMDKKLMRRAITSSATFTVLPSLSILLGVIALSGSLGVPAAWLRLAVIGALQYELNVAEIAATAYGLTGLKVGEMSVGAFVTILLVMTVGILGSVPCCIFGLKKYLAKIRGKKKVPEETVGEKRPGFGAYATIAMFIGLCSAYIGSYVGTLTAYKNYMPIVTALIAAAVMAVFEYFTVRRGKAWLDNFSVATSMLVAMVAAVLINM